ncbi:MAG: hypothetical protein MRERV_2c088 [Mycoplasmataceae bacterium RV_VA103A]|nr:MAG: hypothetical protein MRERV_2c088 [Mycoplasmataceae bacterium RV_VA103A]
MKSTGPSSQKNSQQSDDTLIYILLILLVALLIGALGYWWWQNHKKPKWNYNYEGELGKWTDTPTADDLKQLMLGNRSRLKTTKRFLNDKMRSKQLTEAEKAEVRKELESVDMKMDEVLQGQKLSELAKTSPDFISKFYQLFYEQGKALVRAKTKASSINRSTEKLKRQQKFQATWDISKTEEKEITVQLKTWIDKWYYQAKKGIMPKYKHEGKLPRKFFPYRIEGRKIETDDIPSAEDFNYFLDVNNVKNRTGWKEAVARLQQPLQVNFKGYKGFIRKKDEKETVKEEGKTTLGITYYYHVGDDKESKDYKRYGWEDDTSFLTYGKVDDIKPIRIRLKKEMFLNRLGYEEFITKLDEKGGFSYVDICFESVVDTIAHELAHAIVATFEFKYEGEEGGGHGKLFYDICKEIEVMIREDPEFNKFEKWWYLAPNK